MTGDDEATAGSLDVDHLAELANLPLDGEQAELVEEACRELLAAFQLEQLDEREDEQAPLEPFADEPEPWPEEEIEAILEAFPDREGRSLRT